MLVRILADNPGPTFTRNLDSKFTMTFKEMMRTSRDGSVRQMAMETLESLWKEKHADENLNDLREMWRKEKETWTAASMNTVRLPRFPTKTPGQRDSLSAQAPVQAPNLPPRDINQEQNYFARNHRPKGLPAPHELVGRIEEAKTSAKLLLQVVQSTPPDNVLDNELIKEFAERCQSASRSFQGYISADNPAPDDDTLLTLIETNDQLTLAISKHQRAVLHARKTISSLAATPSPPIAPVALQPRDDQNLDPFRDEVHPMPPTLPGPLAAAGQAQPASGPSRAVPYDSAYNSAEIHYTESYHPGHLPAGSSAQQDLPRPISAESVDTSPAAPLTQPSDRPTPQATMPSYTQRQLSAMEHTTMRGAIGTG